jgi:hypothetical protein
MITVESLQYSLDSVFDEARKINPENRGKIEQLEHHIATCRMLVEQLATETPYVLPTH